jgi:ATP-binding cassette subfamily F protein uup
VPVDDPEARVLATIEGIQRVTRLRTGQDVSASAMLERFGFTGDKLTARIGDLSGGERRRFQLLRLLLSEPNVLLLDEPTNDLDIDTLNVVEDFLDSWPGTLVVVSHDRYFLERVTDSVWALLGDGQVSMLPRGVEEYLELRAAAQTETQAESQTPPAPVGDVAAEPPRTAGSAGERAARKAIARIDKQLERVAAREAELHAEMAQHLSDHGKLSMLSGELGALAAEKEALESEWLEASELLS